MRTKIDTAIIPIDKILPNPQQPRREIDPAELQVLADSIAQHGLINPISVEEAGDAYILIDGERRWRAAQLAGEKFLPALVRPSSNGSGERERLALALVANIQRSDMNPVEEGYAFKRLFDMGYKITEISKLVGLHMSNVNLRLRLVGLEPEIQELFARRLLPLHTQTITSLQSIPAEKRVRLAQSLANKKASLKSIQGICTRAANAANRKFDQAYDDDQVPAIHAANIHTRREHYDTLARVQRLPAFPALESAAQSVCQDCPLYESASAQTCADCPMVHLLVRVTAAIQA